MTVANNGGRAPLVVDAVAPDEVDPDYTKTVPARLELDRDYIRKVLDDGTPLPFARLGERGRHLKVR